MEKIINLSLIANKIDTKTHKSIKFNIDKEMQILKLEFDYFPKFADKEDDIINAFKNGCCSLTSMEASLCKEKFINGTDKLKNLATVSLYYENEYIGCAHRHVGKQTIIISPKESTDGFINTPIKAGQWEIVISFHAVFTDDMKIYLDAYIE